MRRWAKAVLFTGIGAYFAGGFVAGLYWCDGCDASLFDNTVGRFFSGALVCVLSALMGGFPIINLGWGTHLNCWPFIIGCWLVFLIEFAIWSHFRRRTNAAERGPAPHRRAK